jgi:hypothetical protein
MLICMTRRNRTAETADLFKLGANTPAKGDSSGQHPAASSALLPTDLEASLAILNDTDFDRLLAGVIREASRRHKCVQFLDRDAPAASVKATQQKPKPEGVTAAKANLVRAAFTAGVKPGAISRQFGLSQATIRQVLRSEET